MAFNAMSGTVIMGGTFQVPEGSILSGNLSTSDAANVINIPRVTNATNNAIITNIGGDANTLTCESNLTFDGTILNVTGHVTASLGLSASFLYGDGSNLINVKADHVVAEGPAYSIQFHDSSDGDLTGSSNLIFSSNVLSVSGGIVFNRIQTTANMTASATDYFIAINTNSNPVDVRLPSAALLASGQTYVIKDEGGAASSNNITVLASGSQTIDGQNSIVLESPYASIQLYCNGSDKYFIF